MKWDQVFVAAVSSWLPPRASAADAVASGSYDPATAADNDVVSVTVAEGDIAPPDMAVIAGNEALKRAEADPAEVSVLLHSGLWFQGVDMWPAASYVARHTVGRTVPAYEVHQQCNGAMAELELGAMHLAGTPGAALLTTADRFCAPGIDRWGSDIGMVYGDGATAAVLSSRGGFARLLSTATTADNTVEEVVRGAEFHPAPHAESPLNMIARKEHYVRTSGVELSEALARPVRVIHRSVQAALAQADLPMDAVAHVVVPATGRRMFEVALLLGIQEERTTWEFGRTTGHLGAGDQFAGLAHLAERGVLRPGDRVLMIGGGAGFSCTSAVLEILESPSW